MHFVHYKDYQPVNLAKVGTIGKENQSVAAGTMIYAIAFYEFERKVAYWIFQKQEERDRVYGAILRQASREVSLATPEEAKRPPSLTRI